MKAFKTIRRPEVTDTSEPLRLTAVCQGCGGSGMTTGLGTKPPWCKCKGSCGPYHAPKGSVTLILFMTPEEKAFRDAARVITNEWVDAKSAGADARWTPSLRRRSEKSPIYKAWRKRFGAALAALEKLEAECPHTGRSMYQPHLCDVCGSCMEAA